MKKALALIPALVLVLAVSGCTQQITTPTDPAPQITHIYDLGKYRLDSYCGNNMEFQKVRYSVSLPPANEMFLNDYSLMGCVASDGSVLYLIYGELTDNLSVVAENSIYGEELKSLNKITHEGKTFYINETYNVALLCGNCEQGDNYLFIQITPAITSQKIVEILTEKQEIDSDLFEEVCDQFNFDGCTADVRSLTQDYSKFWVFSKIGEEGIYVFFDVNEYSSNIEAYTLYILLNQTYFDEVVEQVEGTDFNITTDVREDDKLCYHYSVSGVGELYECHVRLDNNIFFGIERLNNDINLDIDLIAQKIIQSV